MGLSNEEIDKMLLEIVKNLPDKSGETNTSSPATSMNEKSVINNAQSQRINPEIVKPDVKVTKQAVRAEEIASKIEPKTVKLNNNDASFNPFSRKFQEEQRKKEEEELNKYTKDGKYQYSSTKVVKPLYAPLIVVRKSRLKDGEIDFTGDVSYPIVSTANAKELYSFQFGYADMFKGYESERYAVVGYVERRQTDNLAVKRKKIIRGNKEVMQETPVDGQVKYIATWFPQYKGSRACSKCDSSIWWGIGEHGENSVNIVMAGVDCSEWQGIDALDSGYRVDDDGNLYQKEENKPKFTESPEVSARTEELVHDKEVADMTFGGMKVSEMYSKMMNLAQQLADVTSGGVNVDQWRKNKQMVEDESANMLMRDDNEELNYNNNIFNKTTNWLQDVMGKFNNTISEDSVMNNIQNNNEGYGDDIVTGEPDFKGFRRTGRESDYIQDFAGFTKALVLDVMHKFGGLSRITSIRVMDDGSILFNGQLYKPSIDDKIIASLPNDIQSCIKNGGVAQIYDWTSMSGMKNLKKFTVEGSWYDFVLYTLAPQYQCESDKFRIDYLFDFLPQLQEIKFDGKVITRANRDEYRRELEMKERPIALQKISAFTTTLNSAIYENMTMGGIRRYKDIWNNPSSGIIKKSFFTVFNTAGVAFGAVANLGNFVATDIVSPTISHAVDRGKEAREQNIRREKGESAYEKFKRAMKSDKF